MCTGNYGSPYAQQPQEQHYPVLSVRVVFLFVQTMVRLPVFGMFNVHTDVDACDCTLGLYLHTCLRTKRTGLGVLTHLFKYQEDWVYFHTCLKTKRTECTYTLVWGPGGQDWVYLHTCLRTRRTRLGVLTHLFEGQQDRTGCTCLRTRRTELGVLTCLRTRRTGLGVLTRLFEDQQDRTGCTYTLVSGPGGTPPRTARSCSLGCPARCRDSHWGRAPSRLPPLHSWFAAGTKLDSMKKMNMPACQKPLPDPPRAKHILVS